jgi:hypothetical protein
MSLKRECTKALTPAEQQNLTYLRNKVDHLQEERFRKDARPSLNDEIFNAVGELRSFTSKLRQKGRNI